jgi:DNA-binding LacI/PurR family transcriptional regulator
VAVPRPRPTITDVAAVAGVSVTTVSHALNNKGRVDSETRARVTAVAQRLGYRPNATARSLRSGRSAIISLLLPPLGAARRSNEALALDFYMRITTAIASVAHAHSHGLLLLAPIQTLQELRAVTMDGAVIVDPNDADPRLDVLSDLVIPFVTVERDLSRPVSPWHVSLDIDGGFDHLLEHLRAQGARRVCLLSSDASWAYAVRAVEAFVTLAAKHSLDARIIRVPVIPLEGAAHDAAGSALDSAEPPDAMVALTDRFATGVMHAARERGLDVPGDLLVASGCDTFHVREARPPITALDMQPELAAKAAVEMLIARLEGREVDAPRMLDYPLVLRDSTRRAGSDPGRAR